MHGHLVSLRGFNCQSILQGDRQVGDAWRATVNIVTNSSIIIATIWSFIKKMFKCLDVVLREKDT